MRWEARTPHDHIYQLITHLPCKSSYCWEFPLSFDSFPALLQIPRSSMASVYSSVFMSLSFSLFPLNQQRFSSSVLFLLFFFLFCHLIPAGSPDARLPATPFYFPSNRNFRITSVFVDVKTRIPSHFHSNCYFFCFICTADIEPTRNGIVLGNLATRFRRYVWI